MGHFAVAVVFGDYYYYGFIKIESDSDLKKQNKQTPIKIFGIKLILFGFALI